MVCIYNANGFADGFELTDADVKVMEKSPEHAKALLDAFIQFRKNELDANIETTRILSEERKDYTTKQFELNKSNVFTRNCTTQFNS